MMPANGYLIRMDQRTGNIVWRSELLGEQSHSSVLYDSASQLLLFGVNNSTIQAIDFKRDEESIRYSPRPSNQHQSLMRKMLFCELGSGLISVEIKSGKINWQQSLSAKSQVSPVLLRKAGLVVAGDMSGKIFAFDSRSGKLKWQLAEAGFADLRQVSSPIVLFNKVGQGND